MFQQALDLHRQGKLDEAARLYEAVLAAEPLHVDALVHLGTLRLAQNRADMAEPVLRRAADAAPASVEAHANLAAALQAVGRGEEAVEHYHRALALEPDLADLRYGLAACLQAQGRHVAAIACYEQLLTAEPAHAEANYGMATLLAELGRADEAVVHYRAALAADADFAEASHGLGTLLARRGAADEAIGCFRQALDVDPDFAAARLALAMALQELGRDDEAIAAFRAVLAQEPGNAAAHYQLAAALMRRQSETEALAHYEAALASEPAHLGAMTGMAGALVALGRHREAIAQCRRAVALDAGCAPAYDMLGFALAELGELAAARDACGRALALAPDRPEFAFNLVQFGTVRPGDAGLAALEAVLPRAASLAPRDRLALHFGLAKAYDDLGERDRGFAHLLEGNAIKRRQIAYDEATMIGMIDHIRRVFTAELFAARADVGDPSGVPVFVVGMPRSGTTLVEQILASHPAVFGAGERRALPLLVLRLMAEVGRVVPFPEGVWLMGGDQLRRMGADYVAGLRPAAPEATRITDKLPANFLWVGIIRLILPHARIIHVSRDAVDTCLSCFSKLFAHEHHYTYELGELGRYHRAYQRLTAHWRAALPAGAMLEVGYEAVVADLATEARRIVAYCGLPWDDACLEFYKTERPVHTASVTQVRQPIYRSSVGRWRPDAALLRPLLDALAGD